SILSFAGLVLARLGEWDRAEKAWEEVLQYSRRSGNTTLAISMLHNLAVWELNRCRLTACWSRCEEILRLKETVDTSMKVQNTFQVDVAHAHQKMATVLYDRNDLDGAQRMINTALSLYPSDLTFEFTQALKAAIVIEDALGNTHAAYKLIEQWEKLPFPHHAAAYGPAGAAIRAYLDLRSGHIDAVQRWVDTVYGPDGSNLPTRSFLMLVFEETTYSRFLLQTNRATDALTRLDALRTELIERGLVRPMLDVMILRAIALRAMGREDDALDAIAEALTIAAPERIARAFLIDGVDAVRIIRAWRKQAVAIDPVVRRLVDLVEGSFTPDSQRDSAGETSVRINAGMMEPLTTREFEILNLMAAGYSNQKIAGKLYLSVNTIKTHASNLFSKLGASSRVEAISRAREERILQ
ncbi:MAG: hypothetical protein H7X80_06680, partial [bacterium]|nr:hypothetical protein [Candidatus Kapabacteria bacterium]